MEEQLKKLKDENEHLKRCIKLLIDQINLIKEINLLKRIKQL